MSDELVLTSPGEESIGPRLARHREARGLTLATAAAKLHCEESILRALETERFGEIGARVFVQGHLRRYGEFLGIPVDELLADWSRRSASATDPDLRRVPRAPVRAIDPQAWGRRIGAAAAAVVIAVAAWWILRGGSVAQPNAVAPTLPGTAPVVVNSEVASTDLAAPAQATSAVPAEPAPPAEAAMPAEAATPAEAVTPAESATPAAAAIPATSSALSVARPAQLITPRVVDRHSIVVSAAGADCWTEIYDARGQRLFFDLLRRGNRASVEGEAPLRVLLGRADVTTLQVDGKSVVIPANFRRDSTAHVNVYSPSRLERFIKPEDGTGSSPQ